MLTLADLFEGLTGQRAFEDARPVAKFVIDSREVVKDAVFVALRGEKQDGHNFIGDALARGAIAVIAQARARTEGFGAVHHQKIDVAGLPPDPSRLRSETPWIFIVPDSLKALQRLAAFWRQRFPKLQTIGITGSVGKSSTKELTWSVLRRRYHTLKSEGNLNNEIGLPLTLLQVESAHERAVLEMGMYALGEIRTLAEIARPRIGIVTNVGPTHLERLGTIEHIAVAKSELVQALPSDGWAILNGDDPRVRAMRGQTRAAVQFYGLDAANDVWADEIESLGLEGISFALHRGKESLHVRVPLLGRHSVHTSLAAVCVGLVENLSWDEILHGLQDVAAQLRLVSVPGVRDTTLLDDSYNASPSSTLAALNLLGDLPGRRVAILGDMLELGALEAEGHRVVGYRAAEITDVVIAVGTRGRMIAQAAREVGRAQVIETADNAAAIAAAERVLQPGDFVLVKGSRGMRMEEIVAALSQRAEPEGL